MSNWFQNLGFTPPVQRHTAAPNGAPPVNPPGAPPSPFGGAPSVDQFVRREPLFTGNHDVRGSVHEISTKPAEHFRGQVHHSTFEMMARGGEFPPID